MTLTEVKTHYPGNLKEAVQLLSKLKDSRILAGGTDLLIDIKEGLVSTQNLISLQNITDLKSIEQDNNEIRIGALVTPQQVASDRLIRQHIPSLTYAAGSMASTQIRSLATIGGNICSAVPSADLPPALITADAKIELICSESNRELSLAKFFTGPRETECETNEIMTHISFPLPPPETGFSYQKLTLREANALAVASAAVRLTLADGLITKAVVVLGAVAPIPVIASDASGYLIGKKPSQELFIQAGLKAKAESQPISDIRGSLWYRQQIIQVLTYRALQAASAQAQQDSQDKEKKK